MKQKYYLTFGITAIVKGTVSKTITCEPGEYKSEVAKVIDVIEGRTGRVLEHVSKGEKSKDITVFIKENF